MRLDSIHAPGQGAKIEDPLVEGWCGGKRARFIPDYGLPPYDADVLVSERESVDYFEDVAKGRDAKLAANWVINELFGRLNKEGLTISDSPISSSQLGGIVDLIKDETISGKIAKDVFDIVWTEGGDPAEIVEARGMKQVTDTGAIEKAVDEVLAANPDKVACIYGDAPVCDFKSWPGGKGKGKGGGGAWQACLKAYGLTEEQALAYQGNPIDNLAPLAKAKIPLLNICGAADKVVPVAENTAILRQRYERLGGPIVTLVPG